MSLRGGRYEPIRDADIDEHECSWTEPLIIGMYRVCDGENS
jgi:hypothetical protein